MLEWVKMWSVGVGEPVECWCGSSSAWSFSTHYRKVAEYRLHVTLYYYCVHHSVAWPSLRIQDTSSCIHSRVYYHTCALVTCCTLKEL